MPSKYIKSAKGWSARMNETGVTAVEVYHRDDNGIGPAATRPTVGITQYIHPITGATFDTCICTEAEVEYPEGDDTAETYRYQFTTLRNEFRNDPAARKFQSSLELITVPPEDVTSPGGGGGTAFKWLSDSQVLHGMEVHRRIFNSQFAIPVLVSSANFVNWVQGTVAACAGKINGTSFDHWEIGTVLFDGISGGSRYDNSGNPMWAFDLNFSLKIIPEMKNVTAAGNPPTLGVTSQYTWQHALRGVQPASNNGWDKIIDKNGKPIYATCDLSILNNHGSPIV